ncbi:stage II sporulation protein P [Metabacillus iocasae]|uniref:Stage II sporulation protein P n=1 Tax=Priestia iocasae TaxID=2291674 RepID=A0ABS2QU12_9BACI|nr:stage II sporulation protein P [Metabacillus iocasae]MBM7702973.1 stage II sporulation protein P [Metabacillus iocasae]
MKKKNHQHKAGFIVVTSRAVIISVVVVLLMSSAIAVVSYSAFKDQFRSSVIYQTLSNYKAQSLFYLMSQENQHFSQALESDFQPVPFSSVALELTTNIRAKDSRSLLGSELPGFRIFDSNIIIAGEGTDYTTIPQESSPPLETILEERELAKEEIEKYEENEQNRETAPPPSMTTGDRKVVYLYHTHSWESYLPLLGLEGDPNENKAVDNKTNITLIGDILGKELEARGIGTTVDKTNMTQKLNEKKWKSSRSYTMSRGIVEAASLQNKELTYFIDIHRDSLRKDKTTVNINGKAYAKTVFVLGQGNKNFDQNLQLATDLHQRLQKKYPGLSRGVIGKPKTSGQNGVYNQDLSPNAILVEMGGVDNNMEELTNAAKAIADVFSEMYWDAEKVNAQ